jgi:hypothetical protein
VEFRADGYVGSVRFSLTEGSVNSPICALQNSWYLEDGWYIRTDSGRIRNQLNSLAPDRRLRGPVQYRHRQTQSKFVAVSLRFPTFPTVYIMFSCEPFLLLASTTYTTVIAVIGVLVVEQSGFWA